MAVDLTTGRWFTACGIGVLVQDEVAIGFKYCPYCGGELDDGGDDE